MSTKRYEITLRCSLAWAAATTLLAAALAVQRVPARAPAAGSDSLVPGWWWARPGALLPDLARREYLLHLADAVSEWFQDRPRSPADLAVRLAEFRQGCSIVILSKHPPLGPEDREWLIESCREWAARIEGILIALESGAEPAVALRQADATAKEMLKSLSRRAHQED